MFSQNSKQEQIGVILAYPTEFAILAGKTYSIFMIEIDGVQRQLEMPITEAGDYISDHYFELIDLSTSPDRDNTINIRRIASAIRRLNRNLATTSCYLVGTKVAPVYDKVVEQLNLINADIPDINELQPLITDDPSFKGSSSYFRWSDRELVEVGND